MNLDANGTFVSNNTLETQKIHLGEWEIEENSQENLTFKVNDVIQFVMVGDAPEPNTPTPTAIKQLPNQTPTPTNTLSQTPTITSSSTSTNIDQNSTIIPGTSTPTLTALGFLEANYIAPILYISYENNVTDADIKPFLDNVVYATNNSHSVSGNKSGEYTGLEYTQIPSFPQLNNISNKDNVIFISLWIFADNLEGHNTLLSSSDFAKSNKRGFAIHLYTDDQTYLQIWTDTGKHVISNALPNLAQSWHQLFFEISSSQVNIWVDSVKLDLHSDSGREWELFFSQNQGLIIGETSTRGLLSYDSYIDDFKVYDHTLTDSQILLLYNYENTGISPSLTPTSTSPITPTSTFTSQTTLTPTNTFSNTPTITSTQKGTSTPTNTYSTTPTNTSSQSLTPTTLPPNYRINTIIVENVLNDSVLLQTLQIINEAKSKWENIITERVFTSDDFDMTITFRFQANSNINILGSAILDPANDTQNVNGVFMPFRGQLIFYDAAWYSQLNTYKSNGKTQAYYTVLHEIGHILGIGTLWSNRQFFGQPINSTSTTEYFYLGSNANREYKAIVDPTGSLNINYIPIENDGGSGTAYGHPEEGHSHISINIRRFEPTGPIHPGLDHELMTGFAENNTSPEPLSKVTIGMLEDLNYNVDYSLADTYSLIYNILRISVSSPGLYFSLSGDITGTTTNSTGNFTMNLGDMIDFDLNVSGHPFEISNALSEEIIEGTQSMDSGHFVFKPAFKMVYRYKCSHHDDFIFPDGYITVI